MRWLSFLFDSAVSVVGAFIGTSNPTERAAAVAATRRWLSPLGRWLSRLGRAIWPEVRDTAERDPSRNGR